MYMLSVPLTQPYTSTASVSQAEAAEAGTIRRNRASTAMALPLTGLLPACKVQIVYECSVFNYAVHVQQQAFLSRYSKVK